MSKSKRRLMAKTPATLREAVRIRIETLGISQAEAARVAGMSAPKLSVWLAGKGEIRLDTFESLCAAIGLTVKLEGNSPKKGR